MSNSLRNSRRRSLFVTAEDSMRRLTTFFGSSSTDLTEEALAESQPAVPRQSTTHAQTMPARHGPTLSVSQAPAGRRPMSTFDDFVPPPKGLYSQPQARGSMPNLRAAAGLSAPAPPFAHGASGRPMSSGGLQVPGQGGTPLTVAPMPSEIPRIKKKRKGRFGKKKKDEPQPLAWRMVAGSSTNLESYDCGPLIRGEKVPELYYPTGDTLVYLTDRDRPNPKYSKPVFRIHSSPLLFSALAPYIEDVAPNNVGYSESHLAPQKVGLESAPSVADSGIGQTTLSEPNSAQGSPKADKNERDQGLRIVTSLTGHSDEADRDTAPTRVPTPPTTQTSPRQSQDNNSPSVEQGDEANVLYKIYYPAVDLAHVAKRTDTIGSKGKLKKFENSREQAEDALQKFIEARNLFAFLDQTPLVATIHKEQPYEIFAKLFSQLRLTEDDSHRAFMAEGHLQHYVDELKLDDVRNDDDAILEALVMGERWRSLRLFHEGFIHACGRWDDIKDHPGIALITKLTRSRIDRAYIDLHQIRLSNIHVRIPNFDFPSVWVGDGRHCSKTTKSSYDRMRSLVMNYYKHVYGSWPPRAGRHGKGGGYTESGGLNRMVLQRLYNDLCCVYDLIVDRDLILGERFREEAETTDKKDKKEEKKAATHEEARKRIRKLQEEFDTSCVPVQPTMPFDLPKFPTKMPEGIKRKKKGFFSTSSKKISSEEIQPFLNLSYNKDALEAYKANTFLQQFIQHEREFGVGKSIDESIEARQGRWIFMYCVLQSLPMVVIDAQGLRYGDGVEYFLCENVKGSPPWEKGASKRHTRLSGMWDLGAMAGMSATNLINADDEIDMTFRRSHCWEAAEEWRLIEAGEDDYEDEYYEYGQDSFSEYIPGQSVPLSPGLRGSDGRSPSFNSASPYQGSPVYQQDPQVTDEFRALHLGESAYTPQIQQTIDRENTRTASLRTTPEGYVVLPKEQYQALMESQAAGSPHSERPPSFLPQLQQQHQRQASHTQAYDVMHNSHYDGSDRYFDPARSATVSPENDERRGHSKSPSLTLQMQPFEFDLKPLEFDPNAPPAAIDGTTSPKSQHSATFSHKTSQSSSHAQNYPSRTSSYGAPKQGVARAGTAPVASEYAQSNGYANGWSANSGSGGMGPQGAFSGNGGAYSGGYNHAANRSLSQASGHSHASRSMSQSSAGQRMQPKRSMSGGVERGYYQQQAQGVRQ